MTGSGTNKFSFLPLALMVSLSSTSSSAQSVRVELDVFSGRPNPTWSLSPEQADELMHRLHDLPSANPAAENLPGGLGYRGLVIFGVDGPGTPLRIVSGIVISDRKYRLDPGRSLEQWLLVTGRGHVEPQLLSEVSR